MHPNDPQNPSSNPSETTRQNPPKLFGGSPHSGSDFRPEMGHETGLALGRIGTPEQELRGGPVPAPRHELQEANEKDLLYAKYPAACYGFQDAHVTPSREATIQELQEKLAKTKAEIDMHYAQASVLEREKNITQSVIKARQAEAQRRQHPNTPREDDIRGIELSLGGWLSNFPDNLHRANAKSHLEMFFVAVRRSVTHGH